ncbi:hypothetical protein GOP47_0024098 [Adiantum capillus-veneris]|uniref:Secreted protein n=1 Tax=Adiantum capillus-veneris TaxID=13818 RepID=A0A9D4U5Y4_ADICA|nr:hypothetical protein GOP47_0024098 [Adiantum capillus-veneris]
MNHPGILCFACILPSSSVASIDLSTHTNILISRLYLQNHIVSNTDITYLSHMPALQARAHILLPAYRGGHTAAHTCLLSSFILHSTYTRFQSTPPSLCLQVATCPPWHLPFLKPTFNHPQVLLLFGQPFCSWALVDFWVGVSGVSSIYALR